MNTEVGVVLSDDYLGWVGGGGAEQGCMHNYSSQIQFPITCNLQLFLYLTV